MSNGVFNIAKGRVAELFNRVQTNDPANSALVILILKTAEADATLEDYDTLSALLAGSNAEADFTNYVRKTLTDSDLSAISPDDTNNWMALDFADPVWSSAGGATNNTTAKLIVCYDDDTTVGTDANLIPLTHHDFVVTTDGNDLTGQVAADGFYKAA